MLGRPPKSPLSPNTPLFVWGGSPPACGSGISAPPPRTDAATTDRGAGPRPARGAGELRAVTGRDATADGPGCVARACRPGAGRIDGPGEGSRMTHVRPGGLP